METKCCASCKDVFPLTTEYFHKDKYASGGFKFRCKVCTRAQRNTEYQKEYRIKNQERLKKHASEYKKNNRAMYNEKARDYYARNRDQEVVRNRVWRENNLQKDRELKRKWYHRNIPQIRIAYHRDKHKHLIYSSRRRQLKRANIATLTPLDWKECLKFFDYKDAYTGLPMKVVTKDHVIPLSMGGGLTKSNIIPCDKHINSSKNNAVMEEWFRQQPFFCKKRLKKVHQWIGFNEQKNIQQIALF